MVKVTETTGVYTWLAIRAGQLSKRPPARRRARARGATTAVLSAFLDNLTTVLLMVPITFLLADALDIDPIPLVIIEIFVSNIGGTATLIGDPPNILIAGATGLSFTAFIVNLAPIAAITFVVVTAGLYVAVPPPAAGRARSAPARVMELDAARSIEDLDELQPDRPDPGRDDPRVLRAQAAAPGARHRRAHRRDRDAPRSAASRSRRSLAGIEWPTLFFFIGLFVMVGALEETGAIDEVADGIATLTDGDRTAELLGILWVSAHRLRARRQHPLHRHDDPGRRASCRPATAATTPTGGRSPSAPASAATRRSSPPPPTSPPPAWPPAPAARSASSTFLKHRPPRHRSSRSLLATAYVALRYL